jgi:hypothetical protein
VTSRSDEIEKDVNTVVAEPWVTLDPRLLGKNVIVLSLEVTDDLGKAIVSQPTYHSRPQEGVWRGVPCFIVDLVAESRGVYNGEGDARAFFVQFEL